MVLEPKGMLGIEYIQALVFVACYEYGCSLLCQAWCTVGKAARCAQVQGLQTLDAGNMDPTLKIDSLEMDEKRRVFWAVIEADRISTCGCGYPPVIRLDEVFCRIATDDKMFLAGKASPTIPYDAISSTPSVFKTYSSSCSLYVLQYDVMAGSAVLLSSKAADPKTDSNINGPFWSDYFKCVRMLDRMHEILALRHAACGPVDQNGYNRLRLFYAAAFLVLSRCALHKVENSIGPKDPSLTRTKLQLQCMKHAMDITSIIRLFDDYDGIFGDITVCFPFYVACRCIISIMASSEAYVETLQLHIDYLVAKMKVISSQYRLAELFRAKIIDALRMAFPQYSTLSNPHNVRCGPEMYGESRPVVYENDADFSFPLKPGDAEHDDGQEIQPNRFNFSGPSTIQELPSHSPTSHGSVDASSQYSGQTPESSHLRSAASPADGFVSNINVVASFVQQAQPPMGVSDMYKSGIMTDTYQKPATPVDPMVFNYAMAREQFDWNSALTLESILGSEF